MPLHKINVLFFIVVFAACSTKEKFDATQKYEGVRYNKSAIFEEKWKKLHPFFSDYAFPLAQIHTLAGNYGEIRSGHFHSGLDIKVDNIVGMPILAAQDGYVFRVSVSSFGYGKVIYLRHIDGYFTVYGHLSGFSDVIAAKIKAEQYRQQQFTVDMYFQQEKIWVKKGEVIAYSGNSGASEAPHLHFEIRDFNNKPINPLPFYQHLLKDSKAPTLLSLAISPLDSLSLVNEKPERQFFSLQKDKNNLYSLKNPIFVTGKVGIEYLTFDQMDETTNKFGVYGASLYVDDSLHFQYLLQHFGFDEQKFVNLHTVYEESENYEKCYVAEGNKLAAYKAVNQGVISLKDDKIHVFKLVLADMYGNKTELVGQLQNKPFIAPTILAKDSFLVTYLSPNQSFIYQKEEIKLTLPEKTVYQKTPLSIRTYPKKEGTHSAIYQIGNPNIPLDARYEMRFKLPQPLPKKPVIAYLNGEKWRYLGGKIENDSFIVTKCHTFGSFAVLSDTISPEIIPLNFNEKAIFKDKVLRIHVSDDFSGIYHRSIRGMIDNTWVLWDYDAKTGTLIHTLDENLPKGEHTLHLQVSDNVGNKSEILVKIFCP